MRSLARIAAPLALMLLTCADSASSQPTNIGGTLGIVTLDSGYTDRDSIRLYNPNGTLWYAFSLYHDSGTPDVPNDDFRPFGFKPDYFHLVLAVTRRDSRGYEVIVNHQTGLRKRLRRAPYLEFQTWQQHLLTLFGLDFDPGKTPLRAAPNDSARRLPYPGKSFAYQPVEARGDWVRVAYSPEPVDVRELPKAPSGWVRWRRGGRLLVSLFYFA